MKDSQSLFCPLDVPFQLSKTLFGVLGCELPSGTKEHCVNKLSCCTSIWTVVKWSAASCENGSHSFGAAHTCCPLHSSPHQDNTLFTSPGEHVVYLTRTICRLPPQDNIVYLTRTMRCLPHQDNTLFTSPGQYVVYLTRTIHCLPNQDNMLFTSPGQYVVVYLSRTIFFVFYQPVHAWYCASPENVFLPHQDSTFLSYWDDMCLCTSLAHVCTSPGYDNLTKATCIPPQNNYVPLLSRTDCLVHHQTAQWQN